MTHVSLFSTERLQLEVEIEPPDERAPSSHVVYFLLQGKRIARRAADYETASELTTLVQEPRALMYIATEEDPGIVAYLYALTPDDSDAWKGAEGLEAVPLGIVVRAQEFRVAPDSLLDEAADHFAAILGGKCVEPIDQMMRRLG